MWEVCHFKLILEPTRPKRVDVLLGKDEEAWCAYHRLRGHHTEECHQLKREIEILIQRGRLLSYLKEVKGSAGKRNPSRREPNSKDLFAKKGKNIEEVCETQMAHHTLNSISRGFTGGCETSSARKRYP